MVRLFLTAAIALFLAGSVQAQCGQWQYPPPIVIYVPNYSYGPFRPPVSPATFVPKKGVGLKEEDLPPPGPAEKPKARTDSDGRPIPKIPKPKLPLPEGPEFPSEAKKAEVKNAETVVEQFVVPADEKQSKLGPQVRVGFFNHSEREIVLDVNGEQVKLPSRQYVTLKLPRTFTWAEKGQKGKDVVVPPDADGLEIVFRK